MATVCSWCGKHIGFLDVSYTDESIDGKDYYICGECSENVSAAKKGNITFEEIKTLKTAPELYDYLWKQVNPTDEMIQERKARVEQEKTKSEARQTNPLYDDIHQIAGDLRFIKNYLIFCIIVSVVLGFLWLISIL